MTVDREGLDYAAALRINLPAIMPGGGIVGMATLVDCVDGKVVARPMSAWYTGAYGFLLRDARPLPFFKCPGRLRFFEVAYPFDGAGETQVVEPLLEVRR
jgi:hypothetical protein